MKNIFTRVLLILLSLVFAPHTVLAADAAVTPGKIHHFTIIAPPSAKVGEAIDITVEARDKDEKVITNYRGSIFFQSETDFGATIPAQGKAIQFKESDNGVLKISKGLIFKRVGNQELTVTEALEDVGGSIKIRIEEDATTTAAPTPESITITTPEKGSTVTSDTVIMSGKTKKNSKVMVKLNGVEVGSAQSNDDGIFTYKLTGIDQQVNTLTVSVVDGSNAVIGTAESQFNFGARAPTYYNLSVTPSTEVDAGTGIALLVDAEPGLSEVSLSIDGGVVLAKEQSPGKYSATTKSPATPGAYQIKVTLKNILSQTTIKADALILNVKAPVVVTPTPVTPTPVTPVVPAPVMPTPTKSTFRDVKVTSEGSRINMNFFVDNISPMVTQFKIAYGENPSNLTNEVVTFPLEKIKKPDGSYNWYIDKLPQKSYSFRIFAVQSGGILMPELSSEILSTMVGKASCAIGNINTVNVKTSSDKTLLSWDALSGAISYNVYRVSANKEYELIKNVTENSYTIYLSSGDVAYQDFAVKALCDSTTESSVPAIASRVQTGPGFLTYIIILSTLIGILILRRKTA